LQLVEIPLESIFDEFLKKPLYLAFRDSGRVVIAQQSEPDDGGRVIAGYDRIPIRPGFGSRVKRGNRRHGAGHHPAAVSARDQLGSIAAAKRPVTERSMAERSV